MDYQEVRVCEDCVYKIDILLNVNFITVTAQWVTESRRNSKIPPQIIVTRTKFKETCFLKGKVFLPPCWIASFYNVIFCLRAGYLSLCFPGGIAIICFGWCLLFTCYYLPLCTPCGPIFFQNSKHTESYTFTCLSSHDAKHLWKSAIEHHTFFR